MIRLQIFCCEIIKFSFNFFIFFKSIYYFRKRQLQKRPVFRNDPLKNGIYTFPWLFEASAGSSPINYPTSLYIIPKSKLRIIQSATGLGWRKAPGPVNFRLSTVNNQSVLRWIIILFAGIICTAYLLRGSAVLIMCTHVRNARPAPERSPDKTNRRAPVFQKGSTMFTLPLVYSKYIAGDRPAGPGPGA